MLLHWYKQKVYKNLSNMFWDTGSLYLLFDAPYSSLYLLFDAPYSAIIVCSDLYSVSVNYLCLCT